MKKSRILPCLRETPIVEKYVTFFELKIVAREKVQQGATMFSKTVSHRMEITRDKAFRTRYLPLEVFPSFHLALSA